MAANLIESPFVIITDTDGTALENGYVYIGTVSLEPESNPAVVYWDKALSVVAAQPIRTINGYFSQGGSPGKLYIDADDYSMTVKNKNSVLIFTSLVNTDAAATVAMSNVTGQLDSARVDFTQTGSGAVLKTAEDKFQDIISVKDFGALGDDSNDDTVEIQAAIDSISSGVVYIPAGTYKISATININTTKITLRGDGNTASILKADSGFSGTDVVHMVNPTSCVLEDFQIDADSNVANGLHIDDGIDIAINRLLVQNCTTIGYKIRNVDDCVLNACGSVNTTSYAFDFIASAALDAAASVDGIRCKMIDCYSTNAGTAGSIYSDQIDTSSIDVIVERFNEITNAGSVSVASGSVHLDHKLKLVDCLFLDTILGIAIVQKETDVIRTPGISVSSTTFTPILQLASIFNGSSEYGGMLHLIISDIEYSSSSSKNVSLYLLLVSSDTTAVSFAENEPNITMLFQLNTTTEQIEAKVTSESTATFYFYITQIGGLALSNL